MMTEYLFWLSGDGWLPSIIDIAAKSSLLLVLAATACWLLRRRGSAFRHRVWTFAVGGCALMPVISNVGPQLCIPVLTQQAIDQEARRPFSPTMDRERTEVFESDVAEIESSEMSLGVTRDLSADSISLGTSSVSETTIDSGGTEHAETTTTGTQFRWPDHLLAFWLAGCLILVSQIIVAVLLQRRRLGEMNEIKDEDWAVSVATIVKQLGVTRTFSILQSPAATVPMTCGVLRCVVVVPENWRDWSDEHRKCVLSHELAHVKRNDVAIQLFARLIAAVYWFNPLLWLALYRLRVEREFACDDVVLLSGRRPSDYADALLMTLRDCRPAGFGLGVAMSDSARLDKRVEAVLDTTRQRKPLSAPASLLFVGAAACVVVLVGGVTLTTIAAQRTAVQASSTLSEAITIHGVVVGPDERPVVGAELYLNVNEYQDSLGLGQSNRDGTFRFNLPRETLTRTVGAGVTLGQCQASLFAVADGMGAAWELLPSKNGGRFGDMQSDYEVRLQMVDDLPVNGRIVDESGQPVAKAIVSVDVIHELRGGKWHKMSKGIKSLDVDTMTRKEIDANRWFSHVYPGAFGVIRATTDESGHYELTRLGSHRAVRLRVSGPGVKAPPKFTVLVQDDTSDFAQRVRKKYPPKGKSYGVRLFGINPTIEVIRTRTIAGTIRDAETGQPVERAQVFLLGGTRERTTRQNRVWTDRRGRYRIVHTSDKSDLTVVVDADEHLYLPASRTFSNVEGSGETIADFEIPRGILIHGKVVEADSNRPIASEHRDFCEDQQPGPLLSGYAKYYPLQGNAWINELGQGLVSIPFEYSPKHERRVYIDDKGEFQMAVPPGKGVVLIDASPPRGEPRFLRVPKVPYLTIGGNVTGTTSIFHPAPSELTFPGLQKPIDADNFHAYKLIDVASESDQRDLRFEVKPAPSQSIRFVDPAGNQITDYKVAGLVPMRDYAFSQQSVGRDSHRLAYFDVPINKNRRIVAITGDGRFGVSKSIQQIDHAARTIKMLPTASLKFRLIAQATGKPLAGYQFSLRYGNGVAPKRGFSFDPKKLFTADQNGTVTVTSLIPGEPVSLIVAPTVILPDGRTKRVAKLQTPQQLERLTFQPGEQRNLDTLEAHVAHVQTGGRAEVLVRTTAKSADRFMPVYTLTEFLGQNHAAVIARRSSSEQTTLKDSDNAPFEISDLLKGQRPIEGSAVDARVLRGDTQAELFLLVGKRSTSKNEMRWRVAKSVTEAYREHALAVTKLKHSGAQRLAYFQPLLEHPDQSVSANAHMEFVVASDDAFTSSCERLDRTKIRQWLAEPNITVDRHRLYLSMLARCGNSVDADWLHQKLTSKESPKSLDATLGCYLALKGEAGLRLLNTRYVDNPKATFIQQYSAVQALRFVSTLPSEPLSRKSIIESYRLLLGNSAIADLVIPELMRLKDWESIDRLIELFKEPDNEWTRVPVINFVRACPNVFAKERLQELHKLDPKAVRRSETFFPTPDSGKAIAPLRRTYGGISSGC